MRSPPSGCFLGRRGDSDHWQRPRRRRRRAHDNADRVEQRIRRHARCRGAPLARLLLGRDPAPRRDHSRPLPKRRRPRPQASRQIWCGDGSWGRLAGLSGSFQAGSSKRACSCSSLPTVASGRSSRPCDWLRRRRTLRPSHQAGYGALQPVAMERTLGVLARERRFVGQSGPLPCDGSGAPAR